MSIHVYIKCIFKYLQLKNITKLLYNFKGAGERETDVGQISSKCKVGSENRPFKIQKFCKLKIWKKWKGAQTIMP